MSDVDVEGLIVEALIRRDIEQHERFAASTPGHTCALSYNVCREAFIAKHFEAAIRGLRAIAKRRAATVPAWSSDQTVPCIKTARETLREIGA